MIKLELIFNSYRIKIKLLFKYNQFESTKNFLKYRLSYRPTPEPHNSYVSMKSKGTQQKQQTNKGFVTVVVVLFNFGTIKFSFIIMRLTLLNAHHSFGTYITLCKKPIFFKWYVLSLFKMRRISFFILLSSFLALIPHIILPVLLKCFRHLLYIFCQRVSSTRIYIQVEKVNKIKYCKLQSWIP